MTTEKELLAKIEAVLREKLHLTIESDYDIDTIPELHISPDDERVVYISCIPQAAQAILPLFQKAEWISVKDGYAEPLSKVLFSADRIVRVGEAGISGQIYDVFAKEWYLSDEYDFWMCFPSSPTISDL